MFRLSVLLCLYSKERPSVWERGCLMCSPSVEGKGPLGLFWSWIFACWRDLPPLPGHHGSSWSLVLSGTDVLWSILLPWEMLWLELPEQPGLPSLLLATDTNCQILHLDQWTSPRPASPTGSTLPAQWTPWHSLGWHLGTWIWGPILPQ